MRGREKWLEREWEEDEESFWGVLGKRCGLCNNIEENWENKPCNRSTLFVWCSLGQGRVSVVIGTIQERAGE